MLKRLTINRLLAAALIALGANVSAGAAESKGSQAAEAKAAAKERAKQGAGNLQDLLKQLREQREALIADHDALAKRLKDAKDEEKKAIKERMEAQMKAFEAQQSALHKRIRDEQRRHKQNAGGKR